MRTGTGGRALLLLAAWLAWLPCEFAAAQAGGTVVEYVNTEDFPGAPGGHYFYASDPPEQAALDAGAAGRFRRTGLLFYTGGDTQVCRFYGSMSPGPNSHFFTADPNECDTLRMQQQVPTPAAVKQWNYEGLGFAVQAKLADGSCPQGAIPVHRAYNNGFARGVDSNHRFSTSRDALDPLLAAPPGWVYEGIVFCTQLPAGQSPLISEALDCGTLASAGGLVEGNLPAVLRRHSIDLVKFPDAQCNDGSGAVMYFRPFAGAANQNRWVIQLQGGGSCGSPEECAQRWCGVDTNYGMTQMSASFSPQRGINGRGILGRSSESADVVSNPHDGYNHVYVHYCSSDSWQGTLRDSTVEFDHPVTSVPTRMRAHFLGSRILDGVIGTLRRDGVPALGYVNAGQTTTMPDLDDADEVLVAGASGGGAGVINNLDRLRDALRATNSKCAGNACPLVFRGLIDSIFAVSVLDLDFSTRPGCVDFGICTPEAVLKTEKSSGQGLLWRARLDQSCVDLLTPLGTDWKCYDDTYVVQNHLTTPYFIRMGLTDENVGGKQIESGLNLPGQPPFTTLSWALKVRADLLALSSIRSTAVEKSAITTVPGVYGPACSDHETLSDNPNTYQVSVRVNNQSWKFFDVWNKWVQGAEPSSIVSSTTTDATCPN